MSLHKDCADALRTRFHALTGGKLGSGHAHEIVAAFFSYGTGSALRMEDEHPLDALPQADILVPDLNLMDARLANLDGLPADLPSVDELAGWIGEYLVEASYFSGSIWHSRDVEDHIAATFVHEDPQRIMDALSSEMAVTNAVFLGFDIENCDLVADDEGMVATLAGRVEGETDEEKPFYGDAIDFETTLTFDLVAGRNGYRAPAYETTGNLDLSFFDGDSGEAA
ncbi:MAG TPA: hypothetical protein VF463_05920 [Sphingobium sp.]